MQSQDIPGEVSSGAELHPALVERGYTSPLAIASAPRAEFVKAAAEHLGEVKAAQVHEAARAQTSFLNTVLAGVRADAANGFGPRPAGLPGLAAALAEPECKDCEAAVSPLAYLADLLDYALKHLRNNNAPVTLDFLAATFHQPFGNLPASCDSMSTQVRQVRICVEVLRSYLDPSGPVWAGLPQSRKDELAAGEKAYRQAAYAMLLTKIGTWYEELRLARGADAGTRQALADRLGIDLVNLDKLYLDSSAIAEENLEKLFGLVNTKRDPLAAGAVPDLQTWRLQHLHALWWQQDWPANPAADARPILDPDLIEKAYLRNQDPNDPIYKLWSTRQSTLQGWFDVLKGMATGQATAARLDALLRSVLQKSAADLTALERLRQQGTDITPQLNQMGLTLEVFKYLVRMANLVAQGTSLLDAEWNDVYNILVQVQKRRVFGAWRAAEQAANLTLGPAYFQFPVVDLTIFPPPPPRQLPNWRATADALRAWQDTLQARIDQEQTTIAGLRDAVSSTEEATLPLLRDALVNATGAPDADQETRADWVTEHLLVDARTGGCQQTTRVAQAIETLQDLLFSVRSGQLEDDYPQLTLDAPHFDQEWDWIGSYATWRAAMFVFLYPENVLLPSLRNRQSPAFRSLVRNLRTGGRLTPDQAREYARGYSLYFRDVCNLQLDLCLPANDADGRLQHYFFARNSKSPAISLKEQKAYWSARDPQAAPSIAQTFWDQVPGLANVLSLDGAAVYRPPLDDRYIYLFARIQIDELQKPAFTRFDLDTGGWAQEPLALDLPNNPADFTAWLNPTAEDQPPNLVIRLTDGTILSRGLNKKGDAWVEGPFESSGQNPTWQSVPTIDCSSSQVAARFTSPLTLSTVTGDFDGDGRDELAVAADHRNAQGNPDAQGNACWVMDFDPSSGTWKHLGPGNVYGFGADFACWADTDPAFPRPYPARFAVAGDFDGDGRAEIAIAPDNVVAEQSEPAVASAGAVGPTPVAEAPINQPVNAAAATSGNGGGGGGGDGRPGPTIADANDFWVMEYVNGQWQHMSPTSTAHPFRADFSCNADGTAPLFAVAGDFDGDGRHEIAIALDLPGDAYSNAFWVMDFANGQWQHLNTPANNNRRKADFYCTTNLVQVPGSDPAVYIHIPPKFAVAGDFDGDGRDEVAIAPSIGGSESNDFWVMDYDPANRTWQHLSPRAGYASQADLDCNAAPIAPRFAVAGDFYGHGRDALAVVPDVSASDGNNIWIFDFVNVDPAEPWGADGFTYRTQFAPVSMIVAADVDRDGREELVIMSGQSVWVVDYDPFERRWKHLPWTGNGAQPDFPIGSAGNPARFVVAGDFAQDGLQQLAFALSAGSAGNDFAVRSFYDPNAQCTETNVAPVYGGSFELTEQLSSQGLQDLRQRTQTALLANTPGLRAYLEEAWYFVPVQVGLELQKQGQYTAALDWFRTVYDYGARQKIYYGLTMEEDYSGAYQHAADWLEDPLNPHAIAATRRNAYTRFTFQSLVECLMAFADAEFTRDTSESLTRARTMYLTAQELLDELAQQKQMDPQLPQAVPAATAQALSLTFGAVLGEQANRLASAHATLLAQPTIGRAAVRIGSVAGQGLVHAPSATASPPVDGEPEGPRAALVRGGTAGTPAALLALPSAPTVGFMPMLSPAFCVPPNPILRALRLRAELNLYYLRTCRNIAGLQRQLELYAAPTDTVSGLPTIGAGGQLVVPGTQALQPTPYRYSVLIERAKQLVNLAQQMEASFLATFEKREAEAYTLFKAQQDVGLAQAGVRHKDLSLAEAQGGVRLAALQQGRAQLQFDYYNGLLEQPESDLEQRSLDLLWTAAGLQAASAAISAISAVQAGFSLEALFTSGSKVNTAVGSGLSSAAQAASTTASILSTMASYKRRKEEWEFQRSLAQQDILIGAQQVANANAHVRVVTQERVIAQLQADHATATIDYLGRKFTNLELYDWMIPIIQNVYRFFLQQAAAIAKLAENQLAFERQEAAPPSILGDYWEAPSDGLATAGTNGRAPDRRGLTGSARLLQDIYQLDQYAFRTDTRKLQLTKTNSLARLDPYAFQRFRETGLLIFATPMELFDRDYPGNYLRLIKRVRTSVIALIPPAQGIRATLTAGPSYAVLGPPFFTRQRVTGGVQSVALSSPMNATGLFDLDTQPEMLLPFEGLGVDTIWELRMPKAANPFDYRTIADVLVTIEYTALDNSAYRQQAIQGLNRTVEADRPFSFRHQFADQWYDLHNPDQTAAPMTVRFTTVRDDFPANIDGLTIGGLVLYIARSDGQPLAGPLTLSLQFTPEGCIPSPGHSCQFGGGATSVDGVFSTSRGNAATWNNSILGKIPNGAWTLALPNTDDVKKLFKNEEIEDILFVVTYTGQLPAWPA